jgi:hypothetical protein
MKVWQVALIFGLAVFAPPYGWRKLRFALLLLVWPLVW